MRTADAPSFKLGILRCDRVAPDLAERHGDYPAMFRQLFDSVRPGLNYADYDLTRNHFPGGFDECDAWLFTGSKWSVYDDEPWIARARELAYALHHAQRPLVGICFGHQLIAEALGGRVAKSGNGWGVGTHTAHVDHSEVWMAPALPELKLLVSHQDQVIDLPAGARRLASHPFCRNDIVQIGNFTLTLQGHPEFTKGYARDLMNKRASLLGEDVHRAGLVSLEEALDSTVAAEWIINFLQQAINKSGP